MNEKLNNIKTKLKKPKTLMIIGIIGILLIGLSSLIPKSKGSSSGYPSLTVDIEEYQKQLQESIKDIVYGVTGDKDATVIVTLESGIRYSYADTNETDTSSSKAEKNEQSSSKNTHSYITVRRSDGSEEALLITEMLPEIRGVAIICKGGDNEQSAEKIKNAVKAALNITSQRVYIAGGN